MVKVISVSDEVYAMLVKLKGRTMSFSETITAMAQKNKKSTVGLMDLFGIMKGKTSAKSMKKELYEQRARPFSDQ